MKSSILAVLAASLCTWAIASAGERELTGDLRALQGKWKVWLAKDDYIILEIQADTLTMTRNWPSGLRESATGSFTINEKPSPKQMTWNNVRGGGLNLEINKCIYELYGDTWLLIGGANDRPEYFYSGNGEPHKAWILKRER
jgi:uncharacterized protein (TIGR03067 family)